MTEGEKDIVKSLIAVAWADGKMEELEASVVEGLLVGFDASAEEEAELVLYAKTPRTLSQDLALDRLNQEDRELLYANAALLTLADGVRSEHETQVLSELAERLGLAPERARNIVDEVTRGDEIRRSEPPRA